MLDVVKKRSQSLFGISLKGDLIPLGIASLAAYLGKHNFGVAALDCIALTLTHDEIVEIIKKRKPRSVCSSSLNHIGRKITQRISKFIINFGRCSRKYCWNACC